MATSGLDRLTEQQRDAVTRLSGLVCVEAGAGAGKTSVIANRFLHLVAVGGLRPSDILTITFTRKAAREMKQRIIAGLDEAGLREQRRDVECAYIHTIHGFCERMLRENPFDAGVDPAFPLLAEGEAARLEERAFEQATGDALTAEGPLRELVSDGSTMQGWGKSEMLGILRDQARGLLNQIRSFGLTQSELAEWAEAAESGAESAPSDALRRALQRGMSEIEELTRLAAEPLLEDLFTALALIPRDDPLAWQADAEPVLQRYKTLLGSKVSPAARKLLTQIRKAADKLSKLGDEVDSDRERAAARRSAALLRLALLTWRHYDALKAVESRLDFSDLELRTLQLLEECEPVRNRYRAKFHQILVDEFQDVNPLQARLVQAISAGDNVCFVGDPRQAIYGFRFGDVEQFLRWCEQTRRVAAEDGDRAKHIPLDTNFRSRPGILRFVARVMERRNRPEFGILSAHRSEVPEPNQAVEVWLSGEDRAPADAQATAAGVRAMKEDPSIRIEADGALRRPKWSDFALLFRKTTQIEQYQSALFAAGIPNQVVRAGRNYYARYEVRDLRNALQALAKPHDDLALVCLLRSPLVGLSMDALTLLTARSERGPVIEDLRPLADTFPPDDCAKAVRFLEWFPPLALHADRREVGQVLGKVVGETQYAAKLLCREDGSRQLANVRKLLQMALESRDLTIEQFVKRLDRLEKINQREGDAPTHEEGSDVVRLMTVHTAKGLEFPIVVLANLFSVMPRHSELDVADPKSRQIGSKIGDFKSVMYEEILERKKGAEVSEEWRLLYVAMTRARDYLVLTLPGRTGASSRETWAGWLRMALGINVPTIEPGVRSLPPDVSYLLRALPGI
jgi:ATP-dependent exoDNAse (exonuclease V) beta subunit